MSARPVRPRLAAASAALTLALCAAGAAAQGPPPPPPGPPPTPRASAAIDPTGNWVAIVNEDWRWRMLTPAKGDVTGVPLNPEGRKLAEAWDPATDGSCLAYGAAGLMRMPTRLRVAWQDDATLKIETDTGVQTRLLYFDAARAPAGPPSLQGRSVADWQRTSPPSGPFGIAFGPPVSRPGGSLRVVTTNLRPGWLRKNGIPYSERTTVTEYFDRFPGPSDTEWLMVTTEVVDPKYLFGRFVTSSHFRREPDGSKWRPRPCKEAAN